MSRSKSMLGIAVLLAFALSAFAAASASAAPSGATAFTCVKGGGSAELFGPHCLKEDTGDKTAYGHVAFETKTEPTTVTATNEATASNTSAKQSGILKGTISGVNTEVTCASVHGEGPLTNKTTGEEMFGHAEGTLNYTGCVVKAPAEKGCKVKGEAVTTEPLTGRTVGSTVRVNIEPINAEKKFTTITIEGCSIAALNNPFPVTGSLEVATNGATLTSTHAEITGQKTLKFGGQNAGLDGALTLKEKVSGTAISVTKTP